MLFFTILSWQENFGTNFVRLYEKNLLILQYKSIIYGR